MSQMIGEKSPGAKKYHLICFIGTSGFLALVVLVRSPNLSVTGNHAELMVQQMKTPK